MKQESVKITTANNQQLDALILSDPQFPSLRPALLVIHGWTSSKTGYIERVSPLVEMGYVCLVFDLRGHGKSDGELKNFSRQDHIADCLAAYDYLSQDPRVNPSDISVYGSSYGGYLAGLLVAQRDVSHLALKAPAQYPDESFEVPTLSLRESMLAQYWHQQVKATENKAFTALHHFKGEVLFLECEKDEVVPHQTIQNYLDSFNTEVDYFVLEGADHSTKNPGSNKALIDALKDWFQDLREERIIETFRKEFPGKTTVESPGFFPTEFLCEVEPTADHPEYSRALAVIDKTAPHVHHKTIETYTVIKGHLLVHRNDEHLELKEGDSLVIHPGEVHWAEGHETLIECYSEPGWTSEDHEFV